MKHTFEHLPQRWAACIQSFLTRPGTRKHTIEDYRTYLAQCFARQAPDALDAEDITAYVESPARRGPASGGVRHNRRSALNQFYTFAMRYIPPGENAPIISHNPAHLDKNARRYSPLPVDPFAHLSQDWQACVRDFLASIEAISGSAKSYASYRSILARFLQTDPGKSPEDFTRTEVRAFITTPCTSCRNRRAALSAATSNSRLSTLTSFYRFASGYEASGAPLLQKKAPTDGLTYQKPGRPRRSMTTDELRRFFAAIDRSDVRGLRDYAFMLFALYSTRRVSELAPLLWGDIEFTMIVDANSARRAGIVFHYSAKGKSRERLTQELPGIVWKHLDAYLVASGRKDTIAAGDPLFAPVNHVHQGTLHPHYCNQLFKEIAARAGLDLKRVSLHSLRHTGATERWNAGEDLRSLQKILGHSSIATTDRYISHLTGNADPFADVLAARLGEL